MTIQVFDGAGVDPYPTPVKMNLAEVAFQAESYEYEDGLLRLVNPTEDSRRTVVDILRDYMNDGFFRVHVNGNVVGCGLAVTDVKFAGDFITLALEKQ